MTVTSRTHIAAAVTLLLFGASAVLAQSLADAARKEEQRRQGVKTPGKALTNKDLKPAPPPPADGVAPAQADAASTSTPAPSDGSPAPGSKVDERPAQPSDEGKRDQKYWSERMKGLQDQVRRDGVLAEAMQSRINALTTDFVNRDDPAQRSVIAKDRQASVEELARLKQAVADVTKAISELEDEARRAGVPAGWLR